MQSSSDVQMMLEILLGVFGLLMVVLVIPMLIGMWKTYEKAGQPGWAAIIPIYSAYIRILICEMPIWWLIVYLIPYVNVIALIVIGVRLAEKFDRSAAFGVGLDFLPFVFYPILGFGSAEYQAG